MQVHQQFNHFGSGVRLLWSTIFISTILLLLVVLVVDTSPVQAFVLPSIGTKTNNPTRYKQQNQKVLYMSLPNPIDTVTSGLVSICRLPGGVTVKEGTTVHDLVESERFVIKVLYDIENSLPCRKVREIITEYDLVVENVIPAGPNSQVFTNPNYQYTLEPNAEIPRMIIVEENDTSTERTVVGTDNILEYFNTKFQLQDTSNDDDTTKQIINVLREIGGYIGTILRIGRGTDIAPTAIGAPRPIQPLILYSYEGNQFCRLVREVLMELDIVYELRSTGKGSIRRKELASITPGGSTQCPYLIDPNTDTAMSESKDIIQYLYTTYGRWVPPNELLQWTSNNIMPLVKPIFTTLTPIQAGASVSSSGDDDTAYQIALSKVKDEIAIEITSAPVVIYTYSLSPFSSETKVVLDNLNIEYKEFSLGAEWIPGLIKSDNGSIKRAALFDITGQSSLPHIFVGGTSIGGLFSGTPGLIPALEQNIFIQMVQDAIKNQSKLSSSSSTITSFQ